jgi:hypothetical protein
MKKAMPTSAAIEIIAQDLEQSAKRFAVSANELAGAARRALVVSADPQGLISFVELCATETVLTVDMLASILRNTRQ